MVAQMHAGQVSLPPTSVLLLLLQEKRTHWAHKYATACGSSATPTRPGRREALRGYCRNCLGRGPPATLRTRLEKAWLASRRTLPLSPSTESYLLWRFWREGWIANKTLHKLAVQVLESELVLTHFCKAEANEIDFDQV